MSSIVNIVQTHEQLNSPFPERSIRTVEDWHKFVSKPAIIKPTLPTREEFASLTDAERKFVNAQRVHYNNSFGPAEVPAMKKIHEAGINLAVNNLRALPGARPGLIIDGDSTIGKSTIAMQLGRKYEQKVTKRHTVNRTPDGHAFIPVAYINLPATMAIMNFNHLLAKFYNIPVSRSEREWEVTDKIKKVAAECATSMFILDDIHFLQIRNRTHATLNNHIKSLANSISATFVYAGIDLEKTGLLTEGKSAEKGHNTQTGHRFKKFDLKAFSMKEEEIANYRQLIDYFDREIFLYNKSPGALFTRFGPYILDRTGGFIGPITQLLREAAFLAITNKEEDFTIKIFEKIRLDYDSEKHFKLAQKRNNLEK